MKLALIGDLHLSERSPRYAHALEVLDWTIRDAVAAGATAFVFCGDLCEGTPSPREYRALLTRIWDCADLGPVGVVLGNHEHPDTLCLLEDCVNVTTAWDRFGRMDLGEAMVLLIPYPRRGRPPFDDCTGDSIAASQRGAAEKIARSVQTAVRLYRDTPLLVCGHFTLEGMTTRDADFELHTATEVVVPRAAFDGVALGAVGHIHRAQDLAPHLLGVGSLIRHSFAEAEDAKSYTLVTVAQGRVSWERRPVPAREMVVYDATWPIDGMGAGEVQHCTGKEVKVVVEIPDDQVATFDPSVFDSIRAAAAHFVLEKRVCAVQRSRAPALARVTSLPEAVTSWLDVTGQGMDDARRARLAEKLAELGG